MDVSPEYEEALHELIGGKSLMDQLREDIAKRKEAMVGEDSGDDDDDWDEDEWGPKPSLPSKKPEKPRVVAEEDPVEREERQRRFCRRKREMCDRGLGRAGVTTAEDLRRVCRENWEKCLRDKGLTVEDYGEVDDDVQEPAVVVVPTRPTEMILPQDGDDDEDDDEVESGAGDEVWGVHGYIPPPEDDDEDDGLLMPPDWVRGDDEDDGGEARLAEEQKRRAEEEALLEGLVLETRDVDPILDVPPELEVSLFSLSAEEEVQVGNMRGGFVAAATADGLNQRSVFADDPTFVLGMSWVSSAFGLLMHFLDESSWDGGQLRLIAALEAAEVVFDMVVSSEGGPPDEQTNYACIFGISLAMHLLTYTRRYRTATKWRRIDVDAALADALASLSMSTDVTPSMVYYLRGFMGLQSDAALMGDYADDQVSAESALALEKFQTSYAGVLERSGGVRASDVISTSVAGDYAEEIRSQEKFDNLMRSKRKLKMGDVRAMYEYIEAVYVRDVTDLLRRYRVGAVCLPLVSKK